MKEFKRLLKQHLTPELVSKYGLTVLAKMLEQDYQEFCKDKLTRSELFMQELPYLKQYGLTAFNAGYAGLIKEGL